MVELPHSDYSASEVEGSAQTTMRGASFRPEYVQWSLRHRNLRRTSGVPLNNIFWCGLYSPSLSIVCLSSISTPCGLCNLDAAKTALRMCSLMKLDKLGGAATSSTGQTLDNKNSR